PPACSLRSAVACSRSPERPRGRALRRVRISSIPLSFVLAFAFFFVFFLSRRAALIVPLAATRLLLHLNRSRRGGRRCDNLLFGVAAAAAVTFTFVILFAHRCRLRAHHWRRDLASGLLAVHDLGAGLYADDLLQLSRRSTMRMPPHFVDARHDDRRNEI